MLLSSIVRMFLQNATSVLAPGVSPIISIEICVYNLCNTECVFICCHTNTIEKRNQRVAKSGTQEFSYRHRWRMLNVYITQEKPTGCAYIWWRKFSLNATSISSVAAIWVSSTTTSEACPMNSPKTLLYLVSHECFRKCFIYLLDSNLVLRHCTVRCWWISILHRSFCTTSLTYI